MDIVIKFRGKDIDGVKWIYGDLAHDENGQNIMTLDENGNSEFIVHQIIPNTVGQYIGKKDINGNEIYDGDIVQGNFPYASTCSTKWNDKRCGFYFSPIDGLKKAGSDIGYKINSNKVQIIGNIYDNPELLME